ncbi:hypothetical protein ACFQS6_15440 [Xanthomonas populi]
MWRGNDVRRPLLIVTAVAVTLAARTGQGMWRLQTPVAGTPLRIGLSAIDDAIGPANHRYASRSR